MGNCVAKSSTNQSCIRSPEQAPTHGSPTTAATDDSLEVAPPGSDPLSTITNALYITDDLPDRLQKLRAINTATSTPLKPPRTSTSSMDDTVFNLLDSTMPDFQHAISGPKHTPSRTLSQVSNPSSRRGRRFSRTDSMLQSLPPPSDADVMASVQQIKDHARFIKLAADITASQPFQKLLARAGGDVHSMRQVHFNAIVSNRDFPQLTLFTRMPLCLEGRSARAALLWLIMRSYDSADCVVDAVEAKAVMCRVLRSAAAPAS